MKSWTFRKYLNVMMFEKFKTLPCILTGHYLGALLQWCKRNGYMLVERMDHIK